MNDVAELKQKLGISELPRSLDARLKLRLSALRRLVIGYFFGRGMSLGLSLPTRLRLWRRGFSAMTHRLYRLDVNPWSDYLDDCAAMDDILVHRHRTSTDDKLTLSHLLERVGVDHPKVLAFISSGRLLEPETPGWRPVADWLAAAAESEQRLVFKPVSGFGGRGIFFLGQGPEGVAINGMDVSRDQAAAVISSLDQYLVTECAEQAGYARGVQPATPNSVRLLTLWDLDLGQPFVAAVAHRFGTAGSGVVDNFGEGRGGLSAAVVLEDGVIGPAARLSVDGRLETSAFHPETGARIEGLVVPHWQRVLDEAVRLAAAVPEIPYIGWDLIVTESGPSWIEANSRPGPAVWQIHVPLLRDPRARAFFSSLNIT